MNQTSATVEAQGARRARYGLNVIVSVAAAVTLVVLINWIAHRHFIRRDFTDRRQYSLSEQTLKVLEQLEGPYRVVTLFTREGPYIDQSRDLIDEYGRYGDNLSIDHIDAGRDIGRVEKFFASLRDRYEAQLRPLILAVQKGTESLERVKTAAGELRTPLAELVGNGALPEGDLQRFIREVASALARLENEIEQLATQVRRDMDSPLPAYGQTVSTIQSLLGDLDGNVFAITQQQFRLAADSPEVPAGVKDGLLSLAVRIERLRSGLQEDLALIRDAPVAADYERVRGQLNNPDPIVLMSGDQAQVLGVGELFREPDARQMPPGQQPRLWFQGEEKLTGALVNMSLKTRPMVVFIPGGSEQAIGPRGTYNQVVQRLENMNFQVKQWSPQPQPGPMGQPMPPGPMPEPEPGQKAVWIALPSGQADPMNPMAAAGGGQVAAILKSRIDAGDAAMVLLTMSQMAQFGAPNQVAEFVEPWGITAQLDRLILREMTLPDNQTRAVSQLDVSSWPDGLSITRAISGTPGVFLQASPLVLSKQEQDSGRLWPLAFVEGEDLWAERDLQGTEQPERDPATSGGPFIIAAAAEREGKRLIVVADPAWASDQVVTYGMLGPGSAELFGAMFPANAELFVNSVYWLAGLDQLIAASPRTQDIRRVKPMTDGTRDMVSLALLGGMPLVVVMLGVGVWQVRRQA